MLELLSWQELLAGAAYALLFRSAPFVGFALASSRIPVLGKLASVAALALLITACVQVYDSARELMVHGAAAWSYLLVAAYAVHALVPQLKQRRPTAAGLLTLSATLFLLVPAMLLRNGATMLLLATGFELTFAAHSYWAELSRARAAPSRLGDCLTFLLVNPTLVYAARGLDLGKAAIEPAALGRIALGLLGLFAAPVLSGLISMLVLPLLAPFAMPALVVGAIGITSHLAVQYVGHSSLASYQIGLMRLCGYVLPERYDYPFLARSPDDFWRRWNTYVGTWLQRYVFLPVAAHYQRKLPQRYWVLGKGAALLAVFAVCGLVHEAAGYALRFTLPVGAFLAFVFYGVVLGLWIAGRTALARMFGGRRSFGAGWRAAGALASVSVSLAAMLIFGWLALPALSGLGLDERLASWLSP